MKEGKSFEISKHQVKEAYRRVKTNHGAGGIDGIDFTEFEKDLKGNLYKLWNRMSSGSYFPKAVRGVEIPKKNGKKRLLGIPTIMDRVAQMVVRMSFEPLIEPIFCSDSYGYRPNCSAIDALGVTRERCWKMAWIIEFDIKGLFDNIDHELLMKTVRKHTNCKWVILYIERFLKTSIMMPDASIQERNAGTPQGGVISPILANLFMHYAFDRWMEKQYPLNPWARYADDGVIHCRAKEDAESILESLKNRMLSCKLEIHPEKSRIAYCRSDQNIERHEHESFDFLGYTFRKRLVRSKNGNLFNSFTPAVSKDAAQHLRDSIRDILKNNKILSLKGLAEIINPKIRGWYNYFSRFCASEARKVLKYLNYALIIQIRFKYKKLKRSKARAYRYLIQMSKIQSNLFYHWQIGVHQAIG
jgi:RNA-directed DNA polymerase